MNKPIVLAQLSTSAASRSASPTRVIKLAKPDGGQAHTVQLGYDQNFKIDLSGIANEKITLVHVGEKLIILFDNQSTLTVDPFYDSANAILGNITFDVGGGRLVDGTQFAGIFPITDDQSVLPAAGDQGGPQAGANFRDASVDPLSTPDPLPLLPQEALGNFVIQDQINAQLTQYSKLSFLGLKAIVEEDHLGHSEGGLFPALSDGNEGPTSYNHTTGNTEDFDNDPSTLDGDDDTWQNFDNTTQTFTAQFVVTGGSGIHTFKLVGLPDFNSILKSQNETIRVHIDPATGVLTGYVDENGGNTFNAGDRAIFTLELTADGKVTFTIYDQLDHDSLDGQPGDNQENNLLVDFSGVILVSDPIAGQSLVLDNIILTVIDDVPVLCPYEKEIHIVDEDDIRTLLSHGTSPNDGNGDGSYTGDWWNNGPGPATVEGSLAHLVKVGADEWPSDREQEPEYGDEVSTFSGPGGGAHFSFKQDGVGLAYLDSLGLSSKGDDLHYDIVGNVLHAYAGDGEGGDRLVFQLTLDINGHYKFELFDQLDHDKPFFGADQNFDLQDDLPYGDVYAIDFGKLIEASDFDGDSIGLDGRLIIKVRDDVPTLVPCDPIQLTVDEDDIKTLGPQLPGESLGTSPNDGNGDGSFTGDPGNNGPGPATVSGHLQGPGGVVVAGADEPLTFSFVYNTESIFLNLGLESKGEALRFDVQGNVLYGYAPNYGGGIVGYDSSDRLVFKFTLNDDGTFKFELFDQLDHDKPASGADQNFDLLDGPSSLYALDFGDVIKATDYDGDSVVLKDMLQIKVRDDVPEVSPCEPIVFTVDEDDISTLGGGVNPGSLGTSPNDSNADGSYTGNPANNNPGPAFVAGSLASVVQSGADENLTFSFISETSLRSYLESLGLTSQGGSLSYDLNGNTLYAFDNAGNQQGQTYDVGQDRLVFTFQITNPATGDFEFKLYDQLDHDAGNGQNFPLEVPGNDITYIEFGNILKATDYDGDSVVLEDMVKIKVRDDVPTLSANLNQDFKVVHDETAGLQAEDNDVGVMPAVFAGFNDGSNNDDPHVALNPIGYASSGVSAFSNIVATYGADEGGTLTYSLQLKNGASSLATSLTVNDVDGGSNGNGDPRTVTLFKQGNYIVGRFDYTNNADGSVDNNSTADDNDPVAFVIGIDASGHVHIIQYMSVNHATANPDEIAWLVNDAIQAVLTIEDYDHDTQSVTVNIGDKIGFSDDGPTANISPKNGAEIRLDETVNGGDDNNDGNPFDGDPIAARTVSGSSLFIDSSVFGADGPKDSDNNNVADSDAKVFSLQLNGGNGTPSGLQDAQNDFPVLLSLVGGVIEGRANGALVFTISINTSNGDTTVTQYRAVEHNDPLDHDENTSPEIMDAGLVDIKVTVKDDDGDSHSDTSELGALIKFEDDGPVVTVRADDHKDADDIRVTLDETTFGGIPDDNTLTDTWVASTSVNPANAIGRVTTPSSATSNVAIADLFDVDYNAGSDGLQSITHQFGLTLKDHNGNVLPNGSGTGVETTMRVTRADGTALDVGASERTIWLFKQADGSILGVINQNGDGPANDFIALRMYLQDAGTDNPKLVVEQYLPIEHPTGGAFSPDEAISLYLKDSDAGVEIAYTVTVTDKDGDSASSTHSIEVIDYNDSIVKIEDDGPSVDVSVALGEGEFAALTLNLDETVQPDGAVNPTYDRANGVGEVADGNGGADDVDPAGAPALVYNRDPNVSAAPASNTAIGRLSTATGQLAGLFGETIDFGTDRANDSNSIVRALSFEMGGSAPYTTNLIVTGLTKEITGLNLSEMSDGQRTISLFVVNATTIEGRMPGDNGDNFVAFRITIENAGDPANAKLVVEQFLPIDHGNTVLGDTETPSILDEQAILKLLGSDELRLKLTTTVKDGDGDTATDSATVTLINANGSFIAFDDDGPKPFAVTASNSAVNGLFFDGFTPNNNEWGTGSGTAVGTAGGWTITPSDIGGGVNPQLEKVADNYRGAHSPTGSLMVDMEASPGNVALSQNVTLDLGETYRLSFEAGMVDDAAAGSAKLEVWYNGNLITTITPVPGVDLPTYSFDVVGTGGPAPLVFKEIGAAGDNTGTYLANITITDIIIIDETEGVQPDSDEVANLLAMFAAVSVKGLDPDMPVQYAQGTHSIVANGAIDYGTDGPAATDAKVITLSASANDVDSGLKTTEGKAIHLFTEGAFVVGRFDADNNGSYETAAFALTVDPVTGVLSLAQFVSLEHPIFPNSYDEGIYLKNGTVLATVTATDGDGDKVSASADVSSLVRFEDDGPAITSVTKNANYGDELIVNGSFEQGHNLPAGQWNIYAQLLPGWTSGPNNVPFELQSNGAGGQAPQEGSIIVELDGDTTGNPDLPPQGVPNPTITDATIQQVVNGLVIGQSYELTFYYAPRPGHEGSSGMTVTFGGVPVWTAPANPSDGWQKVTISVVATAGTETLAFTGTGAEDEFGALLDNVSLKAVYSATVDDEDLTNGIQNGLGDDGHGLVATGKVNFDAGSDGLKSISISGFSGLKAIWVDGSGVGHAEDVTMTYDAGTKTLTGSTTHIAQAFTLVIDNSGNYVFTLKAPLDHPAPVEGPGYENNLQLDFGVTITDGDKDTAAGVICINVDDDIPVAVGEGNLATVEEASASSIIGTVAGLLANDAFGADGKHDTNAITINPQGSLGGTVTVDINGNLVYTPPANVDSDSVETFTYTIKDGDGDTSTATFTVTVTNDTIPDLETRPQNVAVDEDGFAFANVDAGPLLPTETDGNELLVNTGTVSVNYYDDVPANPTAAFSFLLTGLDGQLTTTAGFPVVFGFDGSSQKIVGLANGTPAITIEITGAVPTGGGEIEYTYKVTLAQPLDHPSNSTEDLLSLLGVQFQVTDSNGDQLPVPGSFNVTVLDDVPDATDEGSQDIAEGGVINGAFDFVAGADGAKVTHVNGVALNFSNNGPNGFSNPINLGFGTLEVEADGTYKFTAGNPVDNQPIPVINGNFTVTDGDGDETTADFQFRILDANSPTGGQAFATVDDDGLGGNAASTNGDYIDTNADLDSNEATFSGLLGGSAGLDVPGTWSLAGMNGAPWSLGAESGTYSWLGSTLTANIVGGSRDGLPLFKVEITDASTGAYKVTLLDNVLHTPGLNDELADETLSLTYTITDNDGTTANGSLGITFDDDAPTLAIADSPSTVDENTNFTTGSWSLAAGADGVTSVDVTVNGVTQSLSMSVGTNFVTFPPVAGQPGTLVVKADGTWTYAANTVAADTPVSLTIAATDGDGDTTTDTQQFTIKNVNQPLNFTTNVTGVVEEEHGLPGGIDDTTSFSLAPNNDTDTDPVLDEITNIKEGTILLTGLTGNEGPLSFAFDAANIPTGTQAFKTDGLALTSEGQNVLLHVSGNTLTGYVNGSIAGYTPADDREIFTLEITNTTTGTYKFTLLDNIDHHPIISADNVEDIIGIRFNNYVKVTDTGDTGDSKLVANFAINVIDDIPAAVNYTKEVNEGAVAKVDVVFVVDVSTSMNDSIANIPDFSDNRIGLARYSMQQLLTNNTQIQNVMFTLFSGGASSTVWMTRANALAFVNDSGNWGLSNSTDYDDALQSLINNYGASVRPVAGSEKTVAFFMSDGAPNSSPGGDPGITGFSTGNDVSITEWETFLTTTANPVISQVFAVGIGAGAASGPLNPISYPNTDTDSNGVENNVVMVADANGVTDLTNTLQTFLGSASSISGNVLTGAIDIGFGADGGSIASITVDNVVHQNNGSFITVTTSNGGKFTFYFVAQPGHLAGEWSYLAPGDIPATVHDIISYKLVDGDGDGITKTIDITVNNVNHVPTAGAATGAVDDEGLAHGIVGNGGTPVTGDNAGNATSTGGTLPGGGGDGTLHYSFAGMVGAGVVGQENVNYTYSAGLLTATTVGGTRAGTVLFTVTLNETSGAYTFNLVNPIKHLAGNSEDGDISLVLNYKVSDSDLEVGAGDEASGTLTITLDDDAPVNFAAQSMIIENNANSTGSGALNFYESIGADGGSVVFSGGTDNVTVLKNSSTNANVTSGGKNIVLSGYGTDTLTGKVDLDGNGSLETTVFTVKLNPNASNEAADLYTVQFFRGLDDGSGITITPSNFTDTSARDYKLLNDILGTNDILISAQNGAAVSAVNGSNSGSSTSFGAGNPFVNSGEVLRFDFTNGATVSGSGANNTLTSIGTHSPINGFTFTVKNGTPSVVRVVAIDADNDTTLYNDPDDKAVAITEIYKNGVLVALNTLTADGGGYLISANDGDRIAVFTGTGYDRMEVSYSSGDAFSVADVGYSQINTGSNIPLAFGVTATDGDGDTAAGTIAVTATPLTNSYTGTGNADLLVFGNGNDTVNAGGGNDRIFGGAGSDLMTGGSGSDTFVWNTGEQGANTAGAATTTTYNFVGVTQVNDLGFAHEFQLNTANFANLNALNPASNTNYVAASQLEATNTNYTQISADDVSYWDVGAPSSGNNQAVWFQLDVSNDLSTAEFITINVRAYRPDNTGSGDDLILGIWNYSTNDWEQIGSSTVDNTTTPALLTATLNNAANYVAPDGKVTVMLFNEDTNDSGGNDGTIVVDHVEAIVTKGPTVVDTITDFTAGVGGDVLNFDALLPGAVTNASALTTIDDYLKVEKVGNNTVIHVDHDGGVTFQATMDVVLQGVDLTANNTISSNDVIQNLLNNSQLHV